MATTIRSNKIPRNIRKTRAMDAAGRKRVRDLAMRACTIAAGLDTVLTCRDSGNAELEQSAKSLLDNPEFVAGLTAALKKINAGMDTILTSGTTTGGQYGSRGATINSNIEEQARAIAKMRCAETGSVSESDEEAHYQAALKELQQKGMDSRSGQYVAMDHETRRQMEIAGDKVARLKVARVIGDAGDIVRAQHGMEPRTLVGDEVYALFEAPRVTTDIRRK